MTTQLWTGDERVRDSVWRDFAGWTTSRFFKDFAYPGYFGKTRAYRLGHGSGKKSFSRRVRNTPWVAHRDVHRML